MMAKEHTYSPIPDNETYEDISPTQPHEETSILSQDHVRSLSPSVCSSVHANCRVVNGNGRLNYVTLTKRIERVMFPECHFMERTENMIAMIWGAVVVFIGILFVSAQFNAEFEKYSFVTTYIVLCTFMFIAIVFMSIAIYYRKSKTLIIKDSAEEGDIVDDSSFKDGETYYLIVNCYLFSIGNFLVDMFSILTYFHCGLEKGTPKETQNKYIALLTYHTIRIIFTTLQLAFLQIFSNEKIRRSFQFPFKILIVHVMMTNFSIWFSFLCQETGILSKTPYQPNGEFVVLNCTSSDNNKTQDGVFLLAERVTGFLGPFVFQFSLLAAAMFYSLYPLNFVRDEEPEHRRKYTYGAIDPVRRDNSKIYRFHPAYLAGIMMGLILILSSWTLQDNTHYIYNLRFSYAMQILVHILIMVASVMIVREMRRYHRKRYETLKYKMDDYLLLLTGIGGFLPFLFMVLYSAIKLKYVNKKTFIIHGIDIIKGHQVEVQILLSTLAILNVLSVLTQTFLLLTAHSYKRVPFSVKPTDSSVDLVDDREHYTRLRSSARIGQWLIFLLLLNFSMWIVTSTFELDYGVRTTYFIPSVYWGKKLWGFITHLLYPVLIFYRIHSVAVIAFIWMTFRIKKKTM